jgi:hypothetical protein
MLRVRLENARKKCYNVSATGWCFWDFCVAGPAFNQVKALNPEAFVADKSWLETLLSFGYISNSLKVALSEGIKWLCQVSQ